jgi:hypothetical protein
MNIHAGLVVKEAMMAKQDGSSSKKNEIKTGSASFSGEYGL